jgi:hypothetical protein
VENAEEGHQKLDEIQNAESTDICNKLETMFDKITECTRVMKHLDIDNNTITREIARLRDIQDAILNSCNTTYELLESVKIAQNSMVYDFGRFKDNVEHFHEHILSDYINKHMDDLHKAFDTKMDSMLNVVCKKHSTFDTPVETIKTIKRIRRLRVRGCCMQ